MSSSSATSRMRLTRLLLVLLIPLFISFEDISTLTLVKNFLRGGNGSFYDGQQLCRAMYDDLATIESQEENDLLLPFSSYAPDVWIGLYDDMNAWNWSLGETVFDNVQNFSYWELSKPQLTIVAKICVFMAPNGTWSDELCNNTLPAVCYYAQDQTEYILVTVSMTWEEAQAYCRDNYTDLVSVRNLTENMQVSSLLTEPAWIGLYRQGWAQWSNQLPFIFNNFREQDLELNQTSSESVNCAVANTTTGLWEKVSCDTNHDYICQSYVTPGSGYVLGNTAATTRNGVPLSKNTFKLQLQSDTDLNDPSVQDQILHQLHDKLGKNEKAKFKVHWIQTDTEVFHKTKEGDASLLKMTSSALCRVTNVRI